MGYSMNDWEDDERSKKLLKKDKRKVSNVGGEIKLNKRGVYAALFLIAVFLFMLFT